VLLFSSLFSAIYLFLVAASSFRRADDTQTTENGLYTREIVPAILFLVAAAIEVLGFAGAITVSCSARARWTRGRRASLRARALGQRIRSSV
jgi:hypothetical protein